MSQGACVDSRVLKVTTFDQLAKPSVAIRESGSKGEVGEEKSGMRLEILSNTAEPADLRPSYETAVTQAIGDRPGQWGVWLSQFKPGFPLTIMVKGPKGLRACQIIEEANQQTPDAIRSRISAVLAGRYGVLAP